MNWLDLGVVGIIVLSAVFAFARGFVREALSIVAWVGAAAITLYGFNWAYAQVEPYMHNPLLSQVIAGFGLFVGSLVILTMLTGIVSRMVHFSALSPIDRTLGFIFGVARGVFLVCLAYLLVDTTLPPNDRPGWLGEAKSRPYLHEGADVLKGFLPESLKIKSTEAGDGALRTADPKTSAAEQAKKASGALTDPTPPAAQTGPAPAPDYRSGARRDMNRLIETQR